MRIATYLMFSGNCEEALQVYKDLFSAELITLSKFDETMTDNSRLYGKIFHAEMKIGGFYIYMADTADTLCGANQPYKVTYECDSMEQARLFFKALKEGGIVLDDFKKMPWGMYYSQVRDRFGITWDFVYCP